MTVRAGMRIPVQEVTAPPQSQACVICWNWPAFGLRRCNAGPWCLLVGVGWDLWNWNAGLGEIKVEFLELADCMADPRKPYGKMTNLWGSAATYGEMRQACGCMGKPRCRMGRRPMCGEAAESHRERKSHEKPEYGSGRRWLGMGAAGPHGEPVPMADLT